MVRSLLLVFNVTWRCVFHGSVSCCSLRHRSVRSKKIRVNLSANFLGGVMRGVSLFRAVRYSIVQYRFERSFSEVPLFLLTSLYNCVMFKVAFLDNLLGPVVCRPVEYSNSKCGVPVCSNLPFGAIVENPSLFYPVSLGYVLHRQVQRGAAESRAERGNSWRTSPLTILFSKLAHIPV